MSRLKIYIVSFISVFLICCQRSAKETQMTNSTTDNQSESTSDTLSVTDTSEHLVDSPDLQLTDSNRTDHSPKFAIREGTHSLSIQWISWDELGEAEIKQIGDNKYRIIGTQRNEDTGDYLNIEGTLVPISATELIFDGTVEHKITHLNQGKPCIKMGKQIFKSTKNRKYWRMQDMQNCEGGRVTDYIDIYF